MYITLSLQEGFSLSFLWTLKLSYPVRKPIKQISWTYVLWVNVKTRVVNPSITDVILKADTIIGRGSLPPSGPSSSSVVSYFIAYCTTLESGQKRNRRDKTQRSKYFWYHFEICWRGVRSQGSKIIKIWYLNRFIRIGFISKQYSLCFFSNDYKNFFIN